MLPAPREAACWCMVHNENYLQTHACACPACRERAANPTQRHADPCVGKTSTLRPHLIECAHARWPRHEFDILLQRGLAHERRRRDTEAHHQGGALDRRKRRKGEPGGGRYGWRQLRCCGPAASGQRPVASGQRPAAARAHRQCLRLLACRGCKPCLAAARRADAGGFRLRSGRAAQRCSPPEQHTRLPRARALTMADAAWRPRGACCLGTPWWGARGLGSGWW